MVPSMKHFVGVGVLIALALLARFVVLQPFGVDIRVHDSFYVIPLGRIAFRLLIAMAAVWFFIGVYKVVHHSSSGVGPH